MAAELLAEACQVAFEVARRGEEADPPVPAPAPMRSFLYVPELPRRAMTVAQRVLDEDPAFRARVAAATTEARVGRAGYLWIHRPEGWEIMFSALASGGTAAPTVPGSVAPSPAVPPPPPPAPPIPSRFASSPATPAGRFGTPSRTSAPPPAPRPAGARSVAPPPTHRQASASPSPASGRSVPARAERPAGGRETIETELASLRSLVDRLAVERQSVGDSVESLETEVVERRAESRSLASQLAGAKAELDLVRAERDRVVAERDHLRSDSEDASRRAQTLQGRLTEVEAELATTRRTLGERSEIAEQREAELKVLRAECDTLREKAEAAETSSAEATARLAAVESERNTAVREVIELRTERDRLRDRLRVVDQGRADLETELADVSRKWQRLQSEMTALAEQREAIESELDELAAAHRNSEAERRVLFDELARQLGRVEAERDLLASQLDHAQVRLRGTRSALETASRSLGGELDGADTAFGDASRAAAAIDEAVAEAGRRLESLGATLEAVTIPNRGVGIDIDAEPDETVTDFDDSDDAATQDLVTDDAVTDDVVTDDVAADDVAAEDDDADDEDASIAATGLDEATVIGEATVTDEDPAADAVTVTDDVIPHEGGRDINDSGFDEPVDSGDDLGDDAGFGPVAADAEPFEDIAEDDEWSFDPDEESAYGAPFEERLDLPPASAATSPGSPAPVEVSGRTQIAPIDGDPLTVARHVVRTADVILLIDGDPVAELGWPGLEVASRRDALVNYLGDLVADTGAAADVVFNEQVGDAGDLPHSRVVRLRLSPDDAMVVEALIALVDAYPPEWPIAVVTDDPDLAAEANRRGASVLDNGQLLDLFVAG